PTPPRRTIATLVLSTPAQVVVNARQGVTSVLFLVAMAVGAIALVLAWFSGRRITRPIQLLTQTAEEVREGNLRAEAPVGGEDEVGRLGETFNEMTTSLFKMTNDLRDAAREEHDLRARIETIIQSMADGLVAVDADGNVLAFNREAERQTGIKAAEAIGKPVREILQTKDSHGNDVPLPIYDLAAGSVDNIFVEPRDGRPIPVTIVSAPLADEEGEAAGGVLVMRDMTREREVERMKTEFLSNISHELRTPLTPIKGYAEILGRKDVPPDKAQKFVAGILESTTRLERIVHLLVDFSAMEAGRLSPKTTAVDISMMVEELANEWSKRSDRHSVVTDIHQQVPQVVGDERLLRRSLEEVLDNAMKFSPYGGTIRLEVKGAPAGDGDLLRRLVEVSISDEGIGIPADDIPLIFSDFHQLDGSETRTFGGLGLGLAFVQRIVQAHDGSVTVESRPEHGTRLTIAIPAADGE
ncbi:MAG: sensor histidine kinase, partial [Actinomycetota bacterium]